MSLKLWLPLNGDLHNQGLIDATPTIGGTSVAVNNSGKIGKCYSFGTASGYIDIPVTDIKKISGSCTIAFWLNIRSFNTTWATVFSANRNSASFVEEMLTFQRDNNTSAYTFHISNGTNNTTNVCKTGTLSTGVWYHFVLITDVELAQMRIYQNGELITTYNTSIIPNLGSILNFRIGVSSGGYQADMLLNDFRLYDEVLSVKEIKELSKGLVLHYPLNRGGFGRDNLYTGSYDYSGSWTNLSTWTTETEKYNGFTVKSKTSIWGGLAQNIITSKNDIYTISFYGKVESGGTIVSIHRNATLGNVTTGLSILDGNFSAGTASTWVATSENGTQWKKYWATIKITDDDVKLQWRIENSIADKKICICGMKLEKGSIATPWIPNSADALYSSMGLNSNIEYDVSGYGNNGITTSLTYSSDTPRYNMSSVFNGSNSIIKSQSLPDETTTISIWLKATLPSSGYRMAVHDKKTGLAIGFSANRLITYVGTSGGGAGSYISAPGFINGEWNHIVVVKTGATTRNVYVNGVLKSETGSNYWGGDLEELNIGARHISGSYSAFFNGEISDFRAYTTALSADDVLELYHTPVSITNNGTLMTQGELSEV